jgi:hypothetical protein
VLAGETCVRQILGGRRRANGHGEFAAIFGGEFRERRTNIGIDRRWRRGGIDDLACSRRPARQIFDIIRIEPIKRRMQRRPRAGLIERMAIGFGGHGETVRHANAMRRQLLIHFAERGVLAANQRHIANADLRKETDITHIARPIWRDGKILRLGHVDLFMVCGCCSIVGYKSTG